MSRHDNLPMFVAAAVGDVASLEKAFLEKSCLVQKTGAGS